MSKIHLVNANTKRIPLADRSVHMIATSPPYFGLRMYDTARWVGGDEGCDHVVGGQVEDGKWHGTISAGARPGVDTSTCKRCGAIRIDDQVGLETLHDCHAWARGEPPCDECYVCVIRKVAQELWRVLRDDGTFWLNLGDSYAGAGRGPEGGKYKGTSYRHMEEVAKNQRGILDKKNLIGIPWRVALALQADGWYLRSDIIWAKTSAMPESVKDRPTKAHEYIFLLTKSPKYFYDHEAIKEPLAETSLPRAHRGRSKDHKWADGGPGNQTMASATDLRHMASPSGRNKRTVWEMHTGSFPDAHFAVWPEELVRPMIRAGSSEGGVCSACGAPYTRVTKKSEPVPLPDNPNAVLPYTADGATRHGTSKTTLHMQRKVTTEGWEASCSCGAKKKRALVLDPFAGTGTTGIVAREEDRNFVGLDLSHNYLLMARKRAGLDALDAWNNGSGLPDDTQVNWGLFAPKE